MISLESNKSRWSLQILNEENHRASKLAIIWVIPGILKCTLTITSAEKEVVGAAAAAHEQPQKSFLHC